VKDTKCGAERELSSLDWSGFVVLRCLGNFCWHAYCHFEEISEFWTISDWTEFGLVRSSLSGLDVSCHEFCTVFIFGCMTRLWVLSAETTVICFAVV